MKEYPTMQSIAITLRNDFHDTITTLRPRLDSRDRRILSHRQLLRARRTLCGITDCVCGGLAGERGPQVQFSSDVLTLHPIDENRTEVVLTTP